MSRSFTSEDLIHLPRLGADEAVVLGTQLTASASKQADKQPEKKLPDSIERSKKRLGTALASLIEKVTPPRPSDPLAKRKADDAVDGAWSATFDWARGWKKLPPAKNPLHTESVALFDLAFGDALRFIRMPYRVEWAESKKRLDAFARDGHEKTFAALGGGAFLENLKEAHANYGIALGITVPVVETESGEVRIRLDALLSAMRDYVTKVTAHADVEVAGSEELSRALLLPVTEWEDRAHKGVEVEPDAPPAAPVGPSGPAGPSIPTPGS